MKKLLVCRTCEAAFFTSADEKSICPFCSGPLTHGESPLQADIPQNITITPFTVTRKEALSSLLDWLAQEEFIPEELIPLPAHQPSDGVYLPMMEVNRSFIADWKGEYKSTTYFTTRRWNKHSRRYERQTNSSSSWIGFADKHEAMAHYYSYAGRKIELEEEDRAYLGVHPGKGDALRAAADGELQKYLFMPFVMDEAESWKNYGQPTVNRLLFLSLKDKLQRDNRNNLRNLSLYVKDEPVSGNKLWTPFYVYRIAYKNKNYLLIINGRNSEHRIGKLPDDKVLFRMIMLKYVKVIIPAILTVLTLLILLFSGSNTNTEGIWTIIIILAVITIIMFFITTYQRSRIFKKAVKRRKTIIEKVLNVIGEKEKLDEIKDDILRWKRFRWFNLKNIILILAISGAVYYYKFYEKDSTSSGYDSGEQSQDNSRAMDPDTVAYSANDMPEGSGDSDEVSGFTFLEQGDYVFASLMYLKPEQLSQYSNEQLTIMRQEIYARHGYIFKSRKAHEYFMEKKWYNPKFENVDDQLSDIEKANIELINQFD